MKLIDADMVDEIINAEIKKTLSFEEHEALIDVKFAVFDLPVAYDVEKVIKRLEELHESISCDDWYAADRVWKAIEIVKKGGAE